MTDKTPIRGDVRTICARYFDGHAAGCSRCPIKSECHSSPTMNVTYESMEAWRSRLNAAAQAQINDLTSGD